MRADPKSSHVTPASNSVVVGVDVIVVVGVVVGVVVVVGDVVGDVVTVVNEQPGK